MTWRLEKNPFALLKRMRNYSTFGIMIHLSAILNGAVYWTTDEQGNKRDITYQYGLFEFLLPAINIEILRHKTTTNPTANYIFTTIGLPIEALLQVLTSTFQFIRNVITSTLLYSLSYPLMIVGIVKGRIGKSRYHLVNDDQNIRLENVSTTIYPNTSINNPFRQLMELNVKGFRNTTTVKDSLHNRLNRTRNFIRGLFNAPVRLLEKACTLLFAHSALVFLSLLLFPIPLVLNLITATMSFAMGLISTAAEVISMPIVYIVHAFSLIPYKSLKNSMHELTFTKVNITSDNEELSMQQVVSKYKEANDQYQDSTYKALLNTQILGRPTLMQEGYNPVTNSPDYFLSFQNGNYKLPLTQENSEIVLRALHNNAFCWASDLNDYRDLAETVSALNTLATA